VARHQRIAPVVLAALVLAAGLGLGWRAVQRHDALESNAEDLGFTDQILWNFLHGQFFRFTTYQDAEFQTDIDLKAVRRPDSLLAFHVEPILLPIAPLYWLIPDVRAILWLQALALALGAVPAYRLARRRLGSAVAGLAFAATYLLSPLGQWAALADFHSVALAAPLLLLAIDALDAGHPRVFLLAGLLAASTKEEVGLLVAGLGLVGLLWRKRPMWPCLAALVLGAGWAILCVAVIIPHYSGGAISPFTARYAEIGGSPGAALRTLLVDPAAYLVPLNRPEVRSYGTTLLLGGAWLGLLAPELLLAGLPAVALNVLSSSPWMAAGRAHYSASLLPLVIAAAVVGAGRLMRRSPTPQPPPPCAGEGGQALSLPRARGHGDRTPGGRGLIPAILPMLVLVGAAWGYHRDGIGPLVADLRAPVVTPRDDLGRQLAESIPPAATVSASTGLYPHLSQRAGAYLFPTVRNADYILVDVTTPYPAEPGGVHQRIAELLSDGTYRLLTAEDGFVLFVRRLVDRPDVEQLLPDGFLRFARASTTREMLPLASFDEGAIEMVSARLVPGSEVGPRGPLGTLQTIWRIRRAVPERPRPELTVTLRDGTQQRFSNLPVLWWYPPEQWQVDELVRIDVPGLPTREVVGWEAAAPLDPPG
jgi:uncharacterized membrane protein